MRDPKDLNILVVDDDMDLRKAVVFEFKRKGFNVLEAENGLIAFEIVKTTKIDVVLTDVNMPECNGVKLLEMIKAFNPKTPVVMFITGFADITLEEAYDKGVEAVFKKPFDRKSLYAAVLRVTAQLDQKWSMRKSDRIESQFKIEVRFKTLEGAGQGRLLNIGRGGFFVALDDKIPAMESTIEFNFSFTDGPLPGIEGSGIVRWIRPQKEEDRPSGCGVEFGSLSEPCRAQIISLINSLKTNAFIPRG
ncbi:MAG: response regulator [Bdellovibrionota bacterium]